MFGIGPERVGEAVTFTNEYYGADHPKASRILFVNGTDGGQAAGEGVVGEIGPAGWAWHCLPVPRRS